MANVVQLFKNGIGRLLFTIHFTVHYARDFSHFLLLYMIIKESAGSELFHRNGQCTFCHTLLTADSIHFYCCSMMQCIYIVFCLYVCLCGVEYESGSFLSHWKGELSSLYSILHFTTYLATIVFFIYPCNVAYNDCMHTAATQSLIDLMVLFINTLNTHSDRILYILDFLTFCSLMLTWLCTHHWEFVQDEMSYVIHRCCCLHRCTFTVEPSFVFCENLMFGRRSFKGFNPEVEASYEYYCVIVLTCCTYIVVLQYDVL